MTSATRSLPAPPTKAATPSTPTITTTSTQWQRVNNIAFNPHVNSVNFFGNQGHGNYNALLLEAKKQFSHHYQLDAQFTWGKALDTSSAPYEEDPYPYNPTLSYGRSDYNVGKAFKIFGLWQPVLFHGNSWLEKTAGGWSLSGIFNLHTGFPWTPVYSAFSGSLYCAACGYGSLRPAAYLGGAGSDTSNDAYKSGPNTPSNVNKNFPKAAGDGNAEAYFSVPTFATAATFPAQGPAPQAPGVSRNSFTGPGYRDLDGSLSKSFGLPRIPGSGASEGTKIEIRADVFNLFNNLNFSSSSISNNIENANFGQATSALGGRIVTLQARFSF
jgi:hypothetical protein